MQACREQPYFERGHRGRLDLDESKCQLEDEQWQALRQQLGAQSEILTTVEAKIWEDFVLPDLEEEELSQDSASESSSAGNSVVPKHRPQSESSSLLGGMTSP